MNMMLLHQFLIFLLQVALYPLYASAKRNGIVKINNGVALEVISDSIFRIFRCGHGCVATATQQMQQRASLVVLDEAKDDQVKYGISVLAGTLIVSTRKLVAKASIATGLVDFYRRDRGTLLLKESSSTFNRNDNTTVSQEWDLQSRKEAMFGGGQYVNGFLNYRSAPILMAQFNTEAVVPFVLSSEKYGILWDLYGETMMNEPQQEILLDDHFRATFTPETDGDHWFYLLACHETFGCGGAGGYINPNSVSVTLVDPEGSFNRTVCDHALANLPRSISCRVENLKKDTRYSVVVNGTYADRKLFVTNVDTHNKLTFATQANDIVDYYFMTTATDDSLDSVIANYRRLTGTAALYAKWCYGFWQCKEHYHNQTELLGAATNFRALKIPVDSFVQDWLYWGDLGWGPQWDPKVYPDPAGMIGSLHDSNIHFMVSVWSKFAEKTKFYKEMKEKGALINASNYMDVWDPVARQLFYKYVQDAHFSIGADALWLDATEPEGHAEKGQAIYLGSGDEYTNTYSLMVAKTVHDGLVSNYPSRRVFSLTRSSFAGQQRYGAALWSGDTSGSWDSLRRQIAMSINYQLSGIPYWSMDTGGFFRPRDQYNSADYHHLLIRWFQFAVFTPIFRVHGSGTNTELWNYGPSVQSTIVDSAIRFRYRLLEYIYSGFWKVETEHYTMQRGLILDFENDEKVYDISDQFMFGQAFLVAPLYTADSGRSIYLPVLSSGKWRCFYSANEFYGGQFLHFSNVTLSRIPLFVQSSILILGPDGRQHVNDLPDGTLEVRVYDGSNCHFNLFFDDGISSKPHRPTATIPFSWNEESSTLTIGSIKGDFAVKKDMEIVRVRPGVGVGVDPVAYPDKTIHYDGTAITIKLSVATVDQ